MRLLDGGKALVTTDRNAVEAWVDRWLEENETIDAKFREPLVRLLACWASEVEPGSEDGVRLRAYFSWVADILDGRHTIVLNDEKYAELMQAVEWHEAAKKRRFGKPPRGQ